MVSPCLREQAATDCPHHEEHCDEEQSATKVDGGEELVFGISDLRTDDTHEPQERHTQKGTAGLSAVCTALRWGGVRQPIPGVARLRWHRKVECHHYGREKQCEDDASDRCRSWVRGTSGVSSALVCMKPPPCPVGTAITVARTGLYPVDPVVSLGAMQATGLVQEDRRREPSTLFGKTRVPVCCSLPRVFGPQLRRETVRILRSSSEVARFG